MSGSSLPEAWPVLEQALRHRRPVRIRYHDHDRTVCPHALGWKNGRAKVLVYQAAGATTDGPLPDDPRQRWRSLFIDQIEHAAIAVGPWQTADNYNHHCNGIDDPVVAAET